MCEIQQFGIKKNIKTKVEKIRELWLEMEIQKKKTCKEIKLTCTKC